MIAWHSTFILLFLYVTVTMTSIRRDTHAGSWYSSNASELSKQLSNWLKNVPDSFNHSPARAIISPHAGYRYSGECAAFAYKQIDPTQIEKIFILGPSHHAHIEGCALSPVTSLKTPLYNMEIDLEIMKTLVDTKVFQMIDINTDEDEHSLEMQMPLTAFAMKSRRGHFKVIPIMVGSLNQQHIKVYSGILAPYLNNPNTLFIISSDFCHWGSRFSYTYYDRSQGQIWQSIEHLDKMGMSLIEQLDSQGFASYLSKYRNTICGRNPITLLLATVDLLRQQQNEKAKNFDFKFLKYAQSSKVRDSGDSSVSYAAGSLVIT